jgi:two-component system response regulator WspF
MRIGIVNDMMMAVEAMRRVLLDARGHELAWIARDGAEAVAHCSRDTPDLILMDLIMPEMDGVEATRQIMRTNPCALVVVTANMDRTSSKVFEAMGAGALDVVNTPVLERRGGYGAEALLGKIQTINRLLGGEAGRKSATATPASPSGTPGEQAPLVVIGASAGGPAALARVLSHLQADFRAAMVIVQHVDAHFADGLARWLDSQTPLSVRLAKEGDLPQPGTVLLAGTGDHLELMDSGRLGYTALPADALYRPSIDIFFNSVKREWSGGVLGVLLTGMGRDGARGLKQLHEAGHWTIVQDRATSAVYGMPKAAVEMKAASEILPVGKIGARLATIVTNKINRHGRA